MRSRVLAALTSELQRFSGVLLDVGCGSMPYKSLVLSPPSRVTRYIGLDIRTSLYRNRDVEWDGHTIPLRSSSIDCALATEVLEHCPNPDRFVREVRRVLKPDGTLFLTVPFLWPLHDVPHDEYRYTPFAMERHLAQAGFSQIRITALGGWDASLAQFLGLWIRRRPMREWKRRVLSRLSVPLVRALSARDVPPTTFGESVMISGLAVTASTPASGESE